MSPSAAQSPLIPADAAQVSEVSGTAGPRTENRVQTHASTAFDGVVEARPTQFRGLRNGMSWLAIPETSMASAESIITELLTPETSTSPQWPVSTTWLSAPLMLAGRSAQSMVSLRPPRQYRIEVS